MPKPWKAFVVLWNTDGTFTWANVKGVVTAETEFDRSVKMGEIGLFASTRPDEATILPRRVEAGLICYQKMIGEPFQYGNKTDKLQGFLNQKPTSQQEVLAVLNDIQLDVTASRIMDRLEKAEPFMEGIARTFVRVMREIQKQTMLARVARDVAKNGGTRPPIRKP